MKRLGLLISILIFLLTGCNKEEQLAFDFNQVEGEYNGYFWNPDSLYNLTEGIITINRSDESTFWFSLDSLTSDSLPIFEIKLIPRIFRDGDNVHYAYIELINVTMFDQIGVGYAPLNSFKYYIADNSLKLEVFFTLTLAVNGVPKSQLQIHGKR